jgi:SCY1-like protein 1
VDGAEVSIFKLDKQATPRLQLEAGAHGLQKMKSVRHPYILQYLEGADFEKELVLVTEPVTPLLEWLAGLGPAHREQQVAWGLRCLASALQFLNTTNGMTHGMLCAQAVFVTRGGDWKLGGLDLLCEWRQGGKDTLHFRLHEALTPMEYRSVPPSVRYHVGVVMTLITH